MDEKFKNTVEKFQDILDYYAVFLLTNIKLYQEL